MRRHAYFILAYISVIFVVETVFVAVQARTVQICYIDNRVSIPPRPFDFVLKVLTGVVL